MVAFICITDLWCMSNAFAAKQGPSLEQLLAMFKRMEPLLTSKHTITPLIQFHVLHVLTAFENRGHDSPHWHNVCVCGCRGYGVHGQGAAVLDWADLSCHASFGCNHTTEICMPSSAGRAHATSWPKRMVLSFFFYWNSAYTIQHRWCAVRSVFVLVDNMEIIGVRPEEEDALVLMGSLCTAGPQRAHFMHGAGTMHNPLGKIRGMLGNPGSW